MTPRAPGVPPSDVEDFESTRSRPSPPPTRRAGSFVFVSGQLAVDDEGQLVGRGNWRQQAEHCLKRIESELAREGATMSDVVRLRCYLLEAAGYPDYAAARRQLYPDMSPAGTSVVVAGLLVEGALLEVEATAALPAGVGS